MVYVSALETEGDKELFQKLYVTNRQKLYSIALKIVPNEDYAEDVVHTCFLKLAENFSKYHHEPFDRLERLCSTIVVNVAFDFARKHFRKDLLADGSGEESENPEGFVPDILDLVIEQDKRELVAQALRELKEEERYLLYLQYGLEIKPKEIGELLGMTSVAVRRKMLRCRTKLAKIMEDEKYECLR